MKNEYLNTKATEQMVSNAIHDFCPFGYLAMQAAVNAAIQAGKDSSFVYECVSEFSESCDAPIDKFDPVYCVMDTILQEARTEIENLTGHDFCNDSIGTEPYTAGNFMCTSYDYSSTAREQIIEKLAENDIAIEDLEDATQYFLSGIEISQEDINAAKPTAQ